jgi:hypothetical protein
MVIMPRNRFGKFWAPVEVGHAYRVFGYHTEFIGDCEAVDRDVARFRVIDTLRPNPKVGNKCPFPGCVAREFHGGNHELTSVRTGAAINVVWKLAKFAPVERAA